jgi:hypothetical protein
MRERSADAESPLQPLQPGERPWPIVACALLAFVLGGLTLGLFIAGVEVAGTRPSAAPVFVYTGLMLGLGVGVWRMRYWPVLAFQALLAVSVLGFALAAIRVTNLLWLAICVVVILAGGLLFWKLVRIIGRIQAGEHIRRQADG